MNKNDVIRMARESGITRVMDESSYRWLLEGREPINEVFIKFAELVAAEERERILDMCKEGLWDGEGIRSHLENINKEAEKNGEEL
jgi:hypothetical protein